MRSARDLVRRVSADRAVEVDGAAYSVPWRLIGERVRVTVSGGTIRIAHGGQEVAVHPVSGIRRARVVDPAQFVGVAGADGRPIRVIGPEEVVIDTPPTNELLRPLAEYEALVGGSW